MLPLPVTRSSPPLPHTAPARWAKPHSGLPLCPQPVPSSRQSRLIPFALLILGLGCSIQSLKRKNFLTLPSPLALHIQVLLVTTSRGSARDSVPVPGAPQALPSSRSPPATGGDPAPIRSPLPSGSPLAAAVFFSPDVFSNQKRGESGCSSRRELSIQLIPAAAHSQGQPEPGVPRQSSSLSPGYFIPASALALTRAEITFPHAKAEH